MQKNSYNDEKQYMEEENIEKAYNTFPHFLGSPYAGRKPLCL